jgi:hypothetical protein
MDRSGNAGSRFSSGLGMGGMGKGFMKPISPLEALANPLLADRVADSPMTIEKNKIMQI